MKRRQDVTGEAHTAIPEQGDAEATRLFDRLMKADLDEVRRLVAEVCSPWNVIMSGFKSIRTIRDILVLVFEELHAVRRHRAEITVHAHTDQLTEILNRRGIKFRWQEHHRKPRKQAILIIDLDNFKTVNDRHGHNVGDAVLIEVARRISEVVRDDTSIVGRWGGEEFIIILSGVDEDGATATANRVCKAVSLHPVEVENLGIDVTLSIGVATVEPGEILEQGVDKADSALYQAKRLGKNRVCMFAKSD